MLGVVGWQLPQLGKAVMAYSNHAFRAARAAIASTPAAKIEKTNSPQASNTAVTTAAVKADDTPAQQNLAAARAALDTAIANEKANPTKGNAEAVDSALANYNAAAAARVAEIKGILNGASQAGASSTTDSGPVNNPSNYNALVDELKSLGGLAFNAPTPNITPETEPNNTAATAQTLNLAAQNVTIVSGSITAADQDWFKITVAANSRAWLYVDTGGTQNAGATSRDSQLTLFQSDGTTQIEFDDDDANGNGCDGTNETGLASVIAGRTMTTAGDYLIKVNAFNMTTGVIDPYKLFLVVTTAAPTAESEPNNDSATANSLVTNAQTVGIASGTITAGDLDFYSVQATAGNVLYINADGDPERDNTGADIVVQLRDTNGTTILFSADSSFGGSATNPVGEAFCFTVPADGTYFVVVKHFSASGTGNYNLMVAAANSDAGGDQVCPPTPITSNLGVAGGNFPKVSGTMTQRLFRDGIKSQCGVPRTQAAPVAATRTFDRYSITNTGGATACIFVQLRVVEQAASNYMVGAWLNTFNPANLTQNWLGDPGLSSGIPPALQDFTVNIPAGQTAQIVVFNTNATGDGNAYELTVLGFPTCPPPPPCTLTCPANITVNNTANQCGATVTYAAPTTGGVCTTVTCSPASGSLFPVGTTTVTCTGASLGGQPPGTCSFTVTVNDAQAPSISCPAPQFAGTTGTSAVVNYPSPTVSDNCPGVQAPVCTPPSGSAFNVGVTTVNCSVKDAVNNTASCSFQVTVNRLQTGALVDSLDCTGPGNLISSGFTVTNNGAVAQVVDVTVAMPTVQPGDPLLPAGYPLLLALPGSCVATAGTCQVINSTTINLRVTLNSGASVSASYQAQVNDLVNTGRVMTVSTTAMFAPVPPPAGQPVFGAPVVGTRSITATCQGLGPGNIPPPSQVSDQKAGSVLVYPIYTSTVGSNAQNSRISLTNIHPNLRAFVHLYFVADTCAVSDAFICLTPNQTATFLAADLDPGTTGYLVATAVDGVTGCPINFNYLIGDEYVKFSSGHAANLGAVAISAIAGGLPPCSANSVFSQLNFDGISYNLLPTTVALSNIGARADGNDTLLVINAFGGDMRVTPATLGALFGVLYDDSENAFSFTISSAACQFRSTLNNNTPRTTPRFDQVIPAGRTGWMRIWHRTGQAILGAAINFNSNANASAGAYTGGHNLHVLTLTNTAVMTVPVFPPTC
jgi:hypothetical protein